VPRIAAVVENGSRCCILEELIEGNPLSRSSVDAELARSIWQFYECNGVEARPLADTTDMDEARTSLEEALVALRGHIADWGQATKLGEILQRIAAVQVPIGRCHGDLSRGNLIRVEDRTYMVDLERSHLGCLWRDLAKLCLQSRSFLSGAEECYHVWCRKHGFPLAPAQEVLAAALLVAVHEHWQARGQEGWEAARLERLVDRLDQALKLTTG
jgi:aminoglycoside phosphotransferase (APT) family kinase protein